MEQPKKEKKPTPKPLIAGLALLAQRQRPKKVSAPQKLEATAVDKPVNGKQADHAKKFSPKSDSKASNSNKSVMKHDNSPPKKKPSSVWWKEYDASKHDNMLIKPDKPWYEWYPSLLKDYSPSNSAKPNEADYASIQKLLPTIYSNEVKAFQKTLKELGMVTDQKWLNSVISSGTWSDKIAALTLRIQESPFHNLANFDLLLDIAAKKDLRVSFLAIEAIKDLLINNILPDTTLNSFDYYKDLLCNNFQLSEEEKQKKEETKKKEEKVNFIECALLIWYENEIKNRFTKILSFLDNGLKANIIHFRKESLDILSDFLLKKPENEKKILYMIINKLGDTDGSINTKTMDIIKIILNEHPMMKLVVIKEIKIYLYKRGNSITSIYHGIILLLKIPLTLKDPHEVPLELAECYISLFDKALSAKEEGSRLLASLLHGINKAFPLLKDVSSLFKYLDIIFRLVHTAPSFATSTQALILLSFIAFSTIKKQKQQPFLLSASASTDPSSSSSSTSTASAISPATIQDRYYSALYAKLLSDQVILNTKNSLFFNLLFRSLKVDPLERRVISFLKRISMISLQTPPEITASLLFIISEILQHRPSLKILYDEKTINASTASAASSSSSGSKKTISEEEEEDHGDENDDEGSIRTSGTTVNEGDEIHLFEGYHANKRNPSYACLNNSLPHLYENHLLSFHYHPSVQAFTRSLLSSSTSHTISYDGDPLNEFTIMAFLNRFAYKNPKQKIIEKLKNSKNASNNILRRKMLEEEPVNQEYEKLVKERGAAAGGGTTVGKVVDLHQIPPDKRFFYKYFEEREELRNQGKLGMNRKKNGEDKNVDEEELDEFTDQLAMNMMKHDAISRGEDLGDDDEEADFGMNFGDEDDDSDDDFSDVDDEEMNVKPAVDDEDEMEEEDEEEEEEEENRKSKKSKNNKKRKIEDFESSSSAIDFEDFQKETKGKQQQQQQQQQSKNEKKKVKNNKKKGRNDDDDEDNIPEPEIYHDDMDGFPSFIDEEEFDDDDEEEIPKKKSKKGRKTKKGSSSVEEDEDYDEADLGNAFADADLYEDQMEEIVQQYQFAQSRVEKPVVTSKGKQRKQEKQENKKNKRPKHK
jgi:ribosome biogenesis protein MAK21